jgi:hypothetical protein
MRKRAWEWHSDAKPEVDDLRQEDRELYGSLASRLVALTSQSSGSLGDPARGRVRSAPFSSGQSVGYVYFVERADGRGLGGLLVCRCARRARRPPRGAGEAAVYRLASTPEW